MSYEITRASLDDKDRYASHIAGLFPQYLSEEELDHKLALVLQAESLHQLDDLLVGLPRPAQPPRPRDYAIPRNFLPVCLGWTLGGLTLAIGPTVALSGHHGAVADTVSALCLLWGIWIATVSFVMMVVKGSVWDDLSDREQEERRKKDEQGR